MVQERTLISVVIPCYKSANTIEGVVQELEETLETRSSEYAYEIILVNDGSPDGGATHTKLKELSEHAAHIVVVNLAHNFGQHPAIMAGFHEVHGQIVVCMYDDGQTPPNEVYKLIDKVAEGYDIAYASYGQGKRHSAWRNLGSQFNELTARKYMKVPRDLEVTSYFAVKRFAVDSAIRYSNPYPFVEGLLFQAVETYCNVPVKHRSRVSGESGYTMAKLISLWSNGVTAFSVQPLRIAAWVGVILAIIGFIQGIIIVVHKIVDPSLNEGWASIIDALVVIGGLILLMMGIIGEYVGRIYLSLNAIPQYVVRDKIDHRLPNGTDGRNGTC